MADVEKAVKSLKKNPLLINIALGLLLLTNFLNILAFSTTSWGRVNSISGGGFYGVGLWRICSSGITAFFVETFCTETTGWPQDWYAAAQFFAIVGLVGITGSLVSLLLYLCGANSCLGKPKVLFWTAVCLLVTAILYLIGIIIFGVEFPNNYVTFITGLGGTADLAWSFGVAIVADILAIIVGILLLYQSRKTRSTSPGKPKIDKSSNKKDQSSQGKKKPESHGKKNQDANKNANSKPVPIVTKSSSDQPPAKETDKNRKTSSTVQQNNNNKNANSKPVPIVTKSSSDQPPAKETDKNRKTSSTVQQNNNNNAAASGARPTPTNTNAEQNKGTISNQGQSKQQQQYPRKYTYQPAREPRGQQRNAAGGQPGEAKNNTVSFETKSENQGQGESVGKGQNQQKKNVPPNLNAGPVEVQKGHANTDTKMRMN